MPRKEDAMKVWVVVGVWSGTIEYVKAFLSPQRAGRALAELKKAYGIENGMEAESPHTCELHELEPV